MNNTITKKDYLGTFGAGLFVQGCTVMQAILLARMLGPAGRGEFAAIILWPSLFAGIGLVGVNMAIARVAGEGAAVGGLLRVAVKAALITGTLTTLLCGFSLPVLFPVERQYLLPAAYLYLLSIPLTHLSYNFQGVDHGAGNFKWLNISRMVIYPVYFIGLLLCWYFAEAKVFWVTAALLVGLVSSVLFRMVAYGSRFLSAESGPDLKEIFKCGLPFSVASILAVFYMQMDKVLLVWLLSPEEIGWYVAALAAAGSINVINSALGTVQFTASAQAESGYGFANLAGVLRKGAVMVIIVGGIFAMLLPWLLPLVYGAAFQPAIPIAVILLPGVVLAGLGGIIEQALKGQGRPIASVVSRLLGLIVMGLVGFILGRLFGGKGVAIGYVLGELVATAGTFIIALQLYKDVDYHELMPKWKDILFIINIFKKRLCW